MREVGRGAATTLSKQMALAAMSSAGHEGVAVAAELMVHLLSTALFVGQRAFAQ